MKRFVNFVIRLLLCYLVGLYIESKWEIDILSGFSLAYGVSLVIVLVVTFRKRLPYMELILAAIGIQMIIAPYLEYNYFHNEIFGVMHVPESVYFGFVTWAALALEFGILLFNKQKSELHIFKTMKQERGKYEAIGIKLIFFGYIFYLIGYLPITLGFSFIFATFAFLRFVGLFYLIVCSSKKTWLYGALVFVPFIAETLGNAVFIELIIVGFSTLTIYFLKKRISPILTTVLIAFAMLGAVILQSVKHEYREAVWEGKKASLTSLMWSQQSKLDSEEMKRIGAIFNIRINQGWIVSDVLNHTSSGKHPFDGKYAKDEALGILLPRIIHPDKPIVGSHEKFDYFVGWHLADNTSMNLGLLGDAYGNFGPKKGIIFTFVFGCLIGFGHRKYQAGQLKYPDLICWSPLFYNYLIRAGNEFYIITNWYVKTGFITLIFFLYVRQHLIKARESHQSDTSPVPVF